MFPESQNQSMICSILEREPSRNSIIALEEELKKSPQIECPLDHQFGEGFYMRTIRMCAAPEGFASVITGRIHRHECANFLSEGRVIVSTEYGRDEIVAPRHWISPAGTKRALIILKDAVWTTVHPNPEGFETVEEMERYLTADTYQQLEVL